MMKHGDLVVWTVVVGLLLAGAGAEQLSAAAPPVQESLPESDVVIDRMGGEVTIRRDEVVKRVKVLAGELEIEGIVLEDVQMIAGESQVRGRVEDRVELVAGDRKVWRGEAGRGWSHSWQGDRGDGDFSRLKSRLLGFPKAPSMADLEEAAKTDPGQPESEGLDWPRTLAEIDSPSDRLELFEPASRSFRIRYPSNWRPLDSNQVVGATIVPDGGRFEDGGSSHIVYGIVVDDFDGSGGRRTRNVPYAGRDELERDSNLLIQSLLGSNDYLRYFRESAQEEMVDGERALPGDG
jgi:hypothetical protein